MPVAGEVGRCAAEVLVMLALVSATATILFGQAVDSSPAKYRLCGKYLADLLALVCKERGFYDPFAPKPYDDGGEPYKESRYGVSDECCRMGCTQATMESYCAPPKEPDFTRAAQEALGARHHGSSDSRGSEGRESENSAIVEVSSGSKVSRGGVGGRRKGGGHGGHKKGWDQTRGPRGSGKGKRCRCRRRRRKTDAEALRRQMTHTSFQIGTIPPNFLGTPVILSRTKSRVLS